MTTSLKDELNPGSDILHLVSDLRQAQAQDIDRAAKVDKVSIVLATHSLRKAVRGAICGVLVASVVNAVTNETNSLEDAIRAGILGSFVDEIQFMLRYYIFLLNGKT